MKRFALALARRLPVARAFRYLNRRKSAILMYHGFTDLDSFDGIGNEFHMAAREFEKQLSFLSRHHQAVSLEEIVQHCEGKLRLPDNAVALSMDDGYRGVYDFAFPLLKQYGIPATVFTTTDFVDQQAFLWHDRVHYCLERTDCPQVELTVGAASLALDLSSAEAKRSSAHRLLEAMKALGLRARDGVLDVLEKETGRRLGGSEPAPAHFQPLSWPQVDEMLDSGLVAFGSHTKSHAIVSQCSPSERIQELAGSRAILEERTGRSCTLFCYPNGAVNDFSDTTREWVLNSGYRCGLTTVAGLVTSGVDVFTLPRVDPFVSEHVELKLAGLGELRRALPRASTAALVAS
jgi:peptidoglycan/xylan/chitin deacetylase (PgdA/CDA1 family)